MAAVGSSEPAVGMHPLTLRFGDEEAERELRASSLPKLIAFSKLLLFTTCSLLVAMLYQGRQVAWVCVLVAGLCVSMVRLRNADPYLAHCGFEWCMGALLVAASSTHIGMGASQLEESSEYRTPQTESHMLWPILINLFFVFAWSVCTCWLHLSVWIKSTSVLAPLAAHAAFPIYSELGGWKQETQMIGAALSAGMILGHVLEHSARACFIRGKANEALRMLLVQNAAALESATMRTSAHSVINHTSKRVLANTSQLCETVMQRLVERGLDTTNGDVMRLLASHSAESVAAFHMCRSVLLRSSLKANDYESRPDQFTLHELIDELGFTSNPRFSCAITAPHNAPVYADKLLLQTILFNAGQNALAHGKKGAVVQVVLHLFGNSLSIRICNEPGPNHASLRSLG